MIPSVSLEPAPVPTPMTTPTLTQELDTKDIVLGEPAVTGYKPQIQNQTPGVGYVNKIIEGDAFSIIIGLSVVFCIAIAGSLLVLKIIPKKFKNGTF